MSSSDQAIDFEVRVTLENVDADLRTDLSATADVITEVRKNVPSIPIIALTMMDPDEFEAMPNENREEATPGRTAGEGVEGVFVVEDGVARFRPVEVGIAGDSYFEVVRGLEAGTRIVSGTFQAIRELSDGDPIHEQVSEDARRGADVAEAEESQES
jgi:HlyD family secretion protein